MQVGKLRSQTTNEAVDKDTILSPKVVKSVFTEKKDYISKSQMKSMLAKEFNPKMLE